MAELFDGRTPEQLEKSAERGIELMTDVEKILQQNPSKDIAQWAEAIENVRKQAKRNKTIVGVVGATGAGKSSVINAIMDEERLVPTNCMRACTAVVTEISYNYEEGPKYKADIEFISRQDWLKMLKILFQEVLDGTGHVSREYTNEDSEAGVAYAQIKAVYPELTKEEMEKAPIDRLMSHANAKCLDTTLKLDSDDGTDFYKDLQSYVDSKEKTSGIKGVHDPAKKPCEMEFWPLIRVVRLYVKSPALATGAVIVDLPGVHDSNQARAAVARSYMKQCTGLWIVAPINRAVDDKSAKNLLGESFKRQLKMDGGYDSVTFICSKTDDISLTEAQDSLGLETELGPKWAKSEELRVQKKDLKRQTDSLKQTKADITAAMDVVDEELEKWEKLQEQAADGTAVYRPKEKSQKRKRTEQSSPVRKKSKYTEPDSDDDFFDDDDTRSDARSDYASPEEQGEPLTEVDIAMKIAELRSSKKDGRIEKIKADDSLKDIRRLVAAINEEAGGIDAELSAKCIAGRNEYSREAIRQDYAAGIRGLDQELAEEEDAANFDPEADARDYDEVARNLPVFCVSSRAYQKLQGRLKKDKMPPGFNQTEETEIPALQAHCIQLTTAGRQASCRKVLSSMFQLFNSLHLWALNDGTGSNLTEGQMQREAEILKGKLGKLDSALAKAVGTIVDEINDELSDKVYDVCESAISVAKSGANDTVRKWGSAVDRDNRAAGGLYWSTYKAVCRRNGSLSNVNGSNNFNEQLLEPIIQRLAGPWEAVFARRVPGILNGLPLNAAHILTSFHDDLESRAIRNGTPVISLQMLKQQILVHKETLRDAAGEARGRITEDQRDINREFEPKLTEYMVHAYDVCVQESGPGSFARMKGHMDRHVEQEKRTMFEGAIVHVQGLIKEMLETVQQELLTKVDACYLAVERDYTGVLVSQDNSSGLDALPRQQRSMRKSVLEIIDNAEQVFKRAIGLECGSANESSSMGAVEQRAFSDNDVEAEENVDTAALVQSNLEPAPATS
ncbi:uncharacterized protein HMPREF1541_02701 [Cyphellophora europaea CBS 101466]|uniref:G domain-containing protein n=1 Tax=Cyphellophora europaea (strain CBS 101466) TaxID=1220924 RepID=W2S4C9_CYPE1|nr:uncharacterized protein HMPREF1541_02701 [Cyphellophora europaea CBS 101466]ETN43542.1 hypothetical protein HMPREF1541_02701 [Cyphellophora europaea CBS 101466]